MIWVLTVAVILLGLLALWQHHRIGKLEFWLEVLAISMRATSSPEYHAMQQKIAGTLEQMHQIVLKARATGDLDLANKMMELQHWADSDYSASGLNGMFRGFP